MIKPEYFNKKKIVETSKLYKVDPILLERLTYGFALLGHLASAKIDFVFKGGTALLLVVPAIKRLSIDIDINLNDVDYDLKELFDGIVSAGIFKSWEPDIRASEQNVPKEHYKFFFDSQLTNRELYVLLDILKINSPYRDISRSRPALPFLETESSFELPVPDANGLLADKLTAFAPGTIGVEFKKQKSMEIIKQLFDIGVLFELSDDLESVSEVYRKIAKAEAAFRKLEFDCNKFLEDTIQTSFLIAQMDFRGSVENDYTREFREGINRIGGYVVGRKYSLLKAKEDASAAALFASLLLNEKSSEDLKIIKRASLDTERIKLLNLSGTYSILNKLKSILPRSFYYWSCIAGGEWDFE